MPRRPGITFETVTPSPPEALPRMDVAAFVGFAARGPIDVPVPVEDLARFRDVFGPPLELVPDPEAGRTRTAHLGRTVEAFFRNGGQRCWVVRVAQPADEASSTPTAVSRTSFGLPGLVSAKTGCPSTIRARCYGATFDGKRVGTVLRRRLLRAPEGVTWAVEPTTAPAVQLRWDPRRGEPPPRQSLQAGSLLRLSLQGLRVSAEHPEAPVQGPGPLIVLNAQLRRDLESATTLPVRTFRLYGPDGGELTTVAPTGATEAPIGLVDLPTVEGTAGEEKELAFEVGEFEKTISAYEFELRPEALSLVEVTGTSREGTLTPASATVTRTPTDGHRVAYAPVSTASPDQVRSEGNASEPARTVRAGPVHVFDRAPAGLERQDDSVEVTAEVQTPTTTGQPLPVGASETLRVRRSSGAMEDPGFTLTLVTTPEENEGASSRTDLADLEEQLVHVRATDSALNGWLQLGSAARRRGGDGESKVRVDDIEVRDALWPDTEGNPDESPLPPVHNVERLRFDLLAWEGQELRNRVDRLGFAAAHPRAWTRLPVDDQVFSVEGGEAATPEPGTLHADVFEPRFPLASPESPGEDPFVPLGMADRPDARRTLGRAPETTNRARLERERLARFSPRLFVDEELSGTHTANLAEKADRRFYLDDPGENASAEGLHSLWPVQEVSLLAVPDAVHRGWAEPQAVTPMPLSAPDPLRVKIGRDADPPWIRLSWTVDRLGEEGVEVELEEATTPTFEAPVVRYQGPESSVDRYVRTDRTTTLFFRYRVLNSGQPGPWSGTRAVTLPEPDFEACMRRPGVPTVERSGNSWISWKPPSSEADSTVGYDVQVARTPGFDRPRDVEAVPESPSAPPALPPEEQPPEPQDRYWYEVPTSPERPAIQYVRVRAVRDAGEERLLGGWSNTVAVARPLEQGTPCISRAEYDNPQPDTPGRGRNGLFDVHRAMLRFGAARGDVLSVLALPERDQSDDALRHVRRLRTPGAVLEYGEEQTLSYGTLYYPWVLGPVGGGGEIGPTPPDGGATGLMARQALRDGAWTSPAHEPLADAQTVVPPLAAAERAELERAPVNAFVEDPDGVLTLGTATLARTPALEPISTRRLLILIRRLVRREGPALVFENNTPRLRRRIAEQFEDVLRRLYRRGAFAGATPKEGYRVVADESVNPPPQVERGRLVVELRVAPARPLAFVTVRLVQRDGRPLAVTERGPAQTA